METRNWIVYLRTGIAGCWVPKLVDLLYISDVPINRAITERDLLRAGYPHRWRRDGNLVLEPLCSDEVPAAVLARMPWGAFNDFGQRITYEELLARIEANMAEIRSGQTYIIYKRLEDGTLEPRLVVNGVPEGEWLARALLRRAWPEYNRACGNGDADTYILAQLPPDLPDAVFDGIAAGEWGAILRTTYADLLHRAENVSDGQAWMVYRAREGGGEPIPELCITGVPEGDAPTAELLSYAWGLSTNPLAGIFFKPVVNGPAIEVLDYLARKGLEYVSVVAYRYIKERVSE